jgi:hypothetical protein
MLYQTAPTAMFWPPVATCATKSHQVPLEFGKTDKKTVELLPSFYYDVMILL